MSELLVKVENMAQFIELYDDEIHVQMPLALKQVIKLKDIVDIEFRRANFFVAGKLVIKYRENGVNEKAYYPFNFMFNDGMVKLVATMNELREKPDDEMPPNVIVKEVIKVRCPYCGSLMDEQASICPACGRQQA